jgi:Tol biopolymer transport system component
LKTSIFDHAKLWVWSAALTAIVVAAGCSDDESSNGNGPTDGVVEISTIIISPRSAEPEDTLAATAVLGGSAAPGNYPSVQWSASGGSFVTDNEMSVRWIAPDNPGVFRLTCRATTGESSDEMSVDVFVGTPQLSVNRNAGQIQLAPTAGQFYYLNSVPRDEEWDSSRVYIQATGVPEPVILGSRRGAQFAFSQSVNLAAYVVNDAGDQWDLDPLAVYVVDLNARSERRITTDRAAPTNQRRNRYTRPYFSPNERWITYEGQLNNPQAGNIDTLDIFIYDLNTDQETSVTAADVTSVQRRNLFPSYSSDSNWLLFASDKGQQNLWDLFGAPLNGSGALADTVRQLTTNGLIGLSPVASLGVPQLAWNPAQPLLAVVGAAGSDGGLHLVTMSAQGATTVDVTDVGSQVEEIAWSGNGQTLAVSSLVEASDGEGVENVIYTVTPAGAATLRHRAREDDRLLDMGWSADAKFLVYRLVRGSESWLELLDIDGGIGLSGPLPITKAVSDGMRALYSAEMSNAVRFGTGDTVYYILFDGSLTPSDTPTIWTLDVSSAVQP